MAWHRRSDEKQRWCGGDGLPEEGSGGGMHKMHGKVLFYSRVLRGGNAACVEGEREVMARRFDRAGVLTCAARRSGDVAVAVALCGGDAEGFSPYIVGEEVSWTGGESMRPRGTHGRASAPWLRGYARVPTGLCRGLDDALSTASVRLAG
jgi:hypothetical protein